MSYPDPIKMTHISRGIITAGQLSLYDFLPEVGKLTVNAQDLRIGDVALGSRQTVEGKYPIKPGDKHVGLVLRTKSGKLRDAQWGRYTKIQIQRDS